MKVSKLLIAGLISASMVSGAFGDDNKTSLQEEKYVLGEFSPSNFKVKRFADRSKKSFLVITDFNSTSGVASGIAWTNNPTTITYKNQDSSVSSMDLRNCTFKINFTLSKNEDKLKGELAHQDTDFFICDNKYGHTVRFIGPIGYVYDDKGGSDISFPEKCDSDALQKAGEAVCKKFEREKTAESVAKLISFTKDLDIVVYAAGFKVSSLNKNEKDDNATLNINMKETK